jgi:large subunit ribosomal protein L3
MGETMKAMLGKKLTMSQAETPDGRRVPVTRITAGPVIVTAIKTLERDGYSAVQIGYGAAKRTNKALAGQLKTIDAKPELLKEIRMDAQEEINVGDKLSVADVFSTGEVVDIRAISKGKGFAGGIKRHGFHGGPKTHGQSDRHRAPGSIGSTTTPGRVMKGKRMAGRMGGGQATVQGLEVISIDNENNLLVVKGAIPGHTGTQVLIIKSDKKRKVYHGPQAQALPQGEEAPAEATPAAALAPVAPLGGSSA